MNDREQISISHEKAANADRIDRIVPLHKIPRERRIIQFIWGTVIILLSLLPLLLLNIIDWISLPVLWIVYGKIPKEPPCTTWALKIIRKLKKTLDTPRYTKEELQWMENDDYGEHIKRFGR